MAVCYKDTKEKGSRPSATNHIFMLLYSCSNQGHSPPKHVVTNKDKRAGLKARIISCIQMFVHCFILLTTLNCVVKKHRYLTKQYNVQYV